MPLTADQVEENFGKIERNIVRVENTIMTEIAAIKVRLDKLEGRSVERQGKPTDASDKIRS